MRWVEGARSPLPYDLSLLSVRLSGDACAARSAWESARIEKRQALQARSSSRRAPVCPMRRRNATSKAVVGPFIVEVRGQQAKEEEARMKRGRDGNPK